MSSHLTHSKNALIVLFSSLFSISIGLFFVWPIDIPLPKIFINQFVIQPANYSIAISNLQNPNDFYKISPFDDAIVYSGRTKQKVLPADTTLTNEYLEGSSNLVKKIGFIWQEILRKPQVEFTQVQNPNGLQIIYELTKSQSLDAVLVNKQIRNLPQEAGGFVDAFGFTKNDFVMDSNGVLYTRQDEIKTLQKILHFRDDRIKNVAVQNFNNKDRINVSGVSFFEIINPLATGKIIIKVQPEQKVTLDLNYRLIEIETRLGSVQTEIEHQQIIYFQI